MLHPICRIQYVASDMKHPVCCIRYVASDMLHPLCCIHYAASGVLHPICCIHYVASNMLHPVCCIRYVLHQLAILVVKMKMHCPAAGTLGNKAHLLASGAQHVVQGDQPDVSKFAALLACQEHGLLIMLIRREVLESGAVRQCTNVHALHPMGVLTQCLPVMHPLGILVQEHGVCH
jgi:hypothetical protein